MKLKSNEGSDLTKLSLQEEAMCEEMSSVERMNEPNLTSLYHFQGDQKQTSILIFYIRDLDSP